jgi:hypothetical protein
LQYNGGAANKWIHANVTPTAEWYDRHLGVQQWETMTFCMGYSRGNEFEGMCKAVEGKLRVSRRLL